MLAGLFWLGYRYAYQLLNCWDTILCLLSFGEYLYLFLFLYVSTLFAVKFANVIIFRDVSGGYSSRQFPVRISFVSSVEADFIPAKHACLSLVRIIIY